MKTTIKKQNEEDIVKVFISYNSKRTKQVMRRFYESMERSSHRSYSRFTRRKAADIAKSLSHWGKRKNDVS